MLLLTKSSILVGGQAVIEGVMMRVPGAYATAVRIKDGSIKSKVVKLFFVIVAGFLISCEINNSENTSNEVKENLEVLQKNKEKERLEDHHAKEVGATMTGMIRTEIETGVMIKVTLLMMMMKININMFHNHVEQTREHPEETRE